MGGAAVRGPNGGAAVRGPYGAGAVRGPAGNTAVRGPAYGGGAVYRGGGYYGGGYYGGAGVAAGVAAGAAVGAAATASRLLRHPLQLPAAVLFAPGYRMPAALITRRKPRMGSSGGVQRAERGNDFGERGQLVLFSELGTRPGYRRGVVPRREPVANLGRGPGERVVGDRAVGQITRDVVAALSAIARSTPAISAPYPASFQ